VTGLLELAGITQRFGGVVALSEIELSVPEGSIFALMVLISYSTSRSYMSATSSIKPSISPVSSPTAIICSVMGVNTPVAAAVRNMLSPRSTPSRICSIRRAI